MILIPSYTLVFVIFRLFRMTSTNSECFQILASAPPFNPPPILLFEASLSHLWSIWECVVLCEPILLFGASPAQTSQAAWWFRDLLRPVRHTRPTYARWYIFCLLNAQIPLAGDIRPYFTIHDTDHTLLINKLPPKPGLILGVTNPYFNRSCSHWPHILSLGRYIPYGEILIRFSSLVLISVSRPNTATKTSSTTATPGPPPGWTTKLHKRYISKDRALLKQLEDACRGSEQQSEYVLTFRTSVFDPIRHRDRGVSRPPSTFLLEN